MASSGNFPTIGASERNTGGFTFSEAYNLPIHLRSFYLKRLQTYYKKEADEMQKELNKHKSRTKR